ncbi:hypothetical protein [Brevundimonas sp. FT23028]|uniref:hypothetical protein n=1 Tax=Brevundimonas sp. FT23028 TaxID=3393748 RepID=UPI003B58AB34
MIARLTFIAALAFAPVAAAQDAAPPASAEQVAAASAIADRIIAAADAQGIFVNKTDGAVAQIEHVASGMRCLLDDNPANRVHIFPTGGAGIPRGDDVACIVRNDAMDTDITIYATRYPDRPTTNDIVSAAAQGIRQRWPDATPYPDQVTLATVQGLAAPAYSAFKVRLDGVEKFTMVIGAQQGEWSLKARVTGPYADAMAVSLEGGVMMAFAQIGVSEAD